MSDHIDNPILTIMLRALAREAARQHPIQIVQTASGGFDVMLRLDGTYTYREHAEGVAEFLTDALHDAARPPGILSAADADVTPGSGIGDLLIAMGEHRQDCDQ
ncbi:hypothetical protein RND64_12285 [Gordonia sp. w5E2]|uniref:Uncharacterized protein n=1 Tax=Gordonia jacobaea TaxID=122202 RepID=A0ABR5I7L1_9ACTN|nr:MULTISPECIES: hypothetical protein [Gordonia]KNA89673.1 hypothetical protein ABW18_19940 [Gordonia jacobaea]